MSGKSTYTKEMADRICTDIAFGKSLRSICAEKDTPHMTTVCKWLSDIPNFREKYENARQFQADAILDEIIEIADDPNLDVKIKRVRIHARKWTLSRLIPRKYGKQRRLTHSYNL